MADHKVRIHKVNEYFIFGSLTFYDMMIFLEPPLFKKGTMIIPSVLGIIIDYYFLFDNVVGVGIFDVDGAVEALVIVNQRQNMLCVLVVWLV